MVLNYKIGDSTLACGEGLLFGDATLACGEEGLIGDVFFFVMFFSVMQL
jgi:hypothetical protein